SRLSRPGRRTARTRETPARSRRVDRTERSLGSAWGCAVRAWSNAPLSTRRSELTREAARLFAEKGYHGTSIGDLADARGVQKASVYHHIESKADLLWNVASDGATAFHAALDDIDERLPAV